MKFKNIKQKKLQANPISRLFRSLREQGGMRTLQSALSITEDWFFDWCNGTDTVTRVYQVELDFVHPSKASAHPYIPTRGRAFKKLFSTITFPQDSIFVDYGSGKGKVLLLASKLGFFRVIGIEYSPELHKVAVKNIQTYCGLSSLLIEPICCDATEYCLRDDENIFYFFNPFELDVMQKVLFQIKASLKRSIRDIWVIYFDPRYKDAFENELDLLQIQTFTYGGYDAVVLTNQVCE